MKYNIQQFNMLQDVITHFSENPKTLRSTNIIGSCKYNPPENKPKSIGCAIGMYLTPELAQELDEYLNGSIEDIFESYLYRKLPRWLQTMDIDFLQDVQSLHDVQSYWKNNNISKVGKNCVKIICNDHGLPYDKIKFKI